MRPWGDVSDPTKSATHYQVRSIDDKSQQDWLENLWPVIERNGVPLVVLQPPKSGVFGPSKTIVKLIGGVMPGSDLASRLRDGVVAYVNAIDQSRAEDGIGVPPPFNPPPLNPPGKERPQVPLEFPISPVAPNPIAPATTIATSWLALAVITVAMFALGWVAARLKTRAGQAMTSARSTLAEAQHAIAIIRSKTDPASPTAQTE